MAHSATSSPLPGLAITRNRSRDGLHFDELAIDHLFIDEQHYFKNLETPTKMDRVAGIQTGGSERAFDLYMKCRYLHEQHPGHGVTFATGTPISNSMVELYTEQRFLDPEGLKQRGIEHFDALFRDRNKASYAVLLIMPTALRSVPFHRHRHVVIFCFRREHSA
jgi:N12 class adenine-specific DNA methylase